MSTTSLHGRPTWMWEVSIIVGNDYGLDSRRVSKRTPESMLVFNKPKSFGGELNWLFNSHFFVNGINQQYPATQHQKSAPNKA